MENLRENIENILNNDILPKLGIFNKENFLPTNIKVENISFTDDNKKLLIEISVELDQKTKNLNILPHYEKMIEKMLKNFLVDYEIDIIFL